MYTEISVKRFMYFSLLLLFLFPVLLSKPAASLEGNNCIAGGWCSESFFPFGYPVKALAPGEAAVGKEVILNYKDNAWIKETSLTEYKLEAIWSNAPDNIYAVGGDSTILHYDGDQWRRIDVGSERFIWWRAVAGIGQHVFVAGKGKNIIAHYDGSQWQSIESPDVYHLYLNAIWPLAQDDVYFAGSDGTLLHYDGNQISTIPTGTDKWLNAVYATGADNIFIAGRSGVFKHFDGKNWTDIKVPIKGSLLKMLAAENGKMILSSRRGIFSYHNGETDDMNLPSGTEIDSIWLDESKQLNVLSNQSVLVYSDNQWQVSTPLFTDIIVFDSEHMLACGAAGVLWLFNGKTWQPLDTGKTDDFVQIWGTSWKNYYLIAKAGPKKTVLWHVINGVFEKVDFAVDTMATSIWGSSDKDIFITGHNGVIVHFDGNQWHKQESGTNKFLFKIAGSRADDVWALGDDGTLLHYDGQQWATIDSPLSSNFRILSINAENDIYAASSFDIIHFDGKNWQEVKIEGVENDFTLHDLYTFTNANLLAVGLIGNSKKGMVMTRINGQWNILPPLSAALHAIVRRKDDGLYAVGKSGIRAHLSEKEYRLISGQKTNFSEPAVTPEPEILSTRSEPVELLKPNITIISEQTQASVVEQAKQLTQQSADAVSKGDFVTGLKQLEEAQKLSQNQQREELIKRIKVFLELRK